MAWVRYWSPSCFVCGRENPEGFAAAVLADAGRSYLLVTPRPAFAGFPGMLHGGSVVALLDEAMWYAVYTAGWATLTGSVEVRFLRPAAPGSPLLATAWVHEPREGEPPGPGGARGAGMGAGPGRTPVRRVVATARLLDAGGNLIASGRGRFAPAAALQGIHAFIRSQPAEADLVARVEQWPGL